MLRFLRQHFGGHHANRNPVADNNRTPDQPHLSTAADYVQFEKLSYHGFPLKPTCFVVDTQNKRLAIATAEGRIQIHGNEASGWSLNLPGFPRAVLIDAVPSTGQFLVVADDFHGGMQQIYKISINNTELVYKAYPLPVYMKRIHSTVLIPGSKDKKPQWLVGTASGNIYSFDIDTMNCSEFVVYDDLVSLSRTEIESDKRALLHLAVSGNKLVVVVGSTYYVVLDVTTLEIENFWSTEHVITSANIFNNQVIIGYDNGNFSIATFLNEFIKSEDHKVYSSNRGIPNLKISLNGECGGTVIFIGGLPFESYGDRHAVTLKNSERHDVFDFDSPVIDYFYWPEASVLFVLCEQELCAIDLAHPNLRAFDLPYLYPIHSSPVTCSQVVSDIDPVMYQRIVNAGIKAKSAVNVVSDRPWPLNDDSIRKPSKPAATTVLLTGHESGDVIFWEVYMHTMRPLAVLHTAKEFEGYQDPVLIMKERESEERDPTEPPFVRCGLFESFCDDPRFSVQKAVFDPVSGYLAVGGRAGQVFLFELADDEVIANPPTIIEVDIVGAVQNEPRVNGLRPEVPLPPRKQKINYTSGFQPIFETYVQLKPPVPVQTIAIHASLFHVAIGIEYGYVVCDLKNKSILTKNSLLPADDIVEMVNNDGHLSRFKSVKRTLRQSFRRKKRAPDNDRSFSNMGDTVSNIIEDLRPMEREIVAKPRSTSFNATKGDAPPSSVRMLCYVKAPIGDDRERDLLIVGISGATLYIHSVGVEFNGQRYNKIRDIKLHHDAPVLHVEIMHGYLLLFSEEQIRTFHLPSLRNGKYKYKLTALEGSRIQKVQSVELQCVTDRSKIEKFIAIMTQRGEIFLFYPTNLKKLTKVQYTRPSDGSGVTSAILAKDGTLFFLNAGGSEFRKCSIAASTGLVAGIKQI